MKKKNIPSKDLNTWFKFVKNLPNIEDKEKDKKILPTGTKKTLDLHGFSLSEANKVVHETLEDCFLKGIKALKIITGKGSRSKNFNDPYKSKDLSILKYSVPNYIESKKYLMNKIKEINYNQINDVYSGSFEIILKKN